MSDHPGKKHLSYRYNLGSDITEYKLIDECYVRHYWPLRDINRLIERVIEDKKSRIRRWGKERYKEFMRKNREDHANDKEFWSSAKTIEKRINRYE
ncbi:hypothetical protein NE601_12705 [Erysipelatoclostridium ramosum]|nr:hypothetical protein [Thomasclavelia ramosa]